MRKGDSFWELSPRRLLPLLLFITLSIIGAHTVHGSSGTKPDFVIRKDSPALQNSEGVSNPGQYQLFNRCSSKFVQITKGGRKGRVNSRGKRRSNTTHLIFESHSGGHIYIRGLHRRRYICFNKKGKIILRYTEAPACLFTQLPTSDNFTQLKSVVNPNWFLGFGKRGRRLKGYARRNRKKEKCFHFLAMPLARPSRFSPIDGTNRDKLKHLLKKKS